MESQPYIESKQCKNKKKYAVISPSVRMAFIKRVQSKQTTIKEAAKEFGIKFSTSKAILQTYRKEGRVGKKKTRQRRTSYNLEQKQEKQPEVKNMDVQNQESTTNFQMQLLQQQLFQQQQLMQMGLFMHPLQSNLYLSSLLQQQFMNQQFFGQQTLRPASPLVEFGRMEDIQKQQYQQFTPILLSKYPDSKADEARVTLKDFN